MNSNIQLTESLDTRMDNTKANHLLDITRKHIHSAITSHLETQPFTPDHIKPIFDNYLKTLIDNKKIGSRYEVQHVGIWKCSGIEVNKHSRTIIMHEHRVDEVGTRHKQATTFWWNGHRRITQRMPARMFKRAIVDLKRCIGSETADWNLLVQPVAPVQYLTVNLTIDTNKEHL